MATHTHYVKLTMEVGNVDDTEPHQEIIVNQRTESSEDNTRLQQLIAATVSQMFIELGNEEQAKKPKRKGG